MHEALRTDAREIEYRPAAGIELRPDRPPVFTTPERGILVTDPALARLWEAAVREPLSALQTRFAGDPDLGDIVAESLACLSEAGLLDRSGACRPVRPTAPPASGPSVCAIVVVSAPRELEYLEECVSSVAATTYDPLELLVVDNASGSPVEASVRRWHPSPKILPLPRQMRLARAANLAIAESRTPYVLLMNPDVKLRSDTVARLVACAEASPGAAAVVPKTLFWRARRDDDSPPVAVHAKPP